MNAFKTILGSGLKAAVLILLMAGSLMAADLQSAKNAGQIGEKPDGYIGLVDPNAPGDVKALVSDVNAKRKARYQQIASQQNTPLSQVEQVGGAKAIEMTQRGHYIQTGSGNWVKK